MIFNRILRSWLIRFTSLYSLHFVAVFFLGIGIKIDSSQSWGILPDLYMLLNRSKSRPTFSSFNSLIIFDFIWSGLGLLFFSWLVACKILHFLKYEVRLYMLCMSLLRWSPSSTSHFCLTSSPSLLLFCFLFHYLLFLGYVRLG